jgi:tape measure domain-containing protein
MATQLGDLLLSLKLDASSFEASMAGAKTMAMNQGREIESQLSKTKVGLTATVDDEALTKLNEHLALKQSHSAEVQAYFDANPLRPSFDLSELDNASSQIKDFQRVSQNVGTAGVSIPGMKQRQSIDFDENEIASAVQRGVQKGLEVSNLESFGDLIVDSITGAFSGGRQAIVSAVMAPFKMAGGLVSSVFSGALTGIGMKLSDDLGGGLSKGIQSELSSIFGSFDSVGQAVGKKMFAGIKAEFADEIEMFISPAIKNLVGEKEVAVQGAYVRSQDKKESDKRFKGAQKQVYFEAAQYEKEERSLKNREALFRKMSVDVQNKISEKIEELGLDAIDTEIAGLEDEFAGITDKKKGISGNVSKQKAAISDRNNKIQALTASLSEIDTEDISDADKAIKKDEIQEQIDLNLRKNDNTIKKTEKLRQSPPKTKQQKRIERKERVIEARSKKTEQLQMSLEDLDSENIPEAQKESRKVDIQREISINNRKNEKAIKQVALEKKTLDPNTLSGEESTKALRIQEAILKKQEQKNELVAGVEQQYEPVLERLSANDLALIKERRAFNKKASPLPDRDLLGIPETVQKKKAKEEKKQSEKQAEERLEQVKGKLAEDRLALPEIYRMFAKEVAKESGVKMEDHQIPGILATDKLPKGVNAGYSDKSNRFVVRPEVLEQLKQGKIDAELQDMIAHEIRHGAQGGFGDKKNQMSQKKYLKANTEEKKQFGAGIEGSTDSYGGTESKDKIREEETDAYVFQNRKAGAIGAKVKKDFAIKSFESSVGIGGGKAKYLVSKNANKAVDDFQKYQQAVSVDVSEEIARATEDVKKLKEYVNKTVEGMIDFDGMTPDEIDSAKVKIEYIAGAAGKKIADRRLELQKEIVAKPAQVKANAKETMGTMSKFKELVPIANELGIEGAAKLPKKQLIEQIAAHPDTQGMSDAVQVRSRARAQEMQRRQDSIQDAKFAAMEAAEKAGRFAKGTVDVGQAAAGKVGDFVQSPMVQGAIGDVGNALSKGATMLGQSPMAQNALNAGKQGARAIGGAAQLGYKALEATEGLVLDAIPMGRTAKAVGKNLVLPAAGYAAATHLMPGGMAMANGLEHMVGGVLSPLIQGAGSNLAGSAGNAIAHAVPNVMGLQGAVQAGVGNLISAGTNALSGGAVEMGSLALGGRLMAAGGGRVVNAASNAVGNALKPNEALMPVALPPGRKALQLPESVPAKAETDTRTKLALPQKEAITVMAQSSVQTVAKEMRVMPPKIQEATTQLKPVNIDKVSKEEITPALEYAVTKLDQPIKSPATRRKKEGTNQQSTTPEVEVLGYDPKDVAAIGIETAKSAAGNISKLKQKLKAAVNSGDAVLSRKIYDELEQSADRALKQMTGMANGLYADGAMGTPAGNKINSAKGQVVRAQNDARRLMKRSKPMKMAQLDDEDDLRYSIDTNNFAGTSDSQSSIDTNRIEESTRNASNRAIRIQRPRVKRQPSPEAIRGLRYSLDPDEFSGDFNDSQNSGATEGQGKSSPKIKGVRQFFSRQKSSQNVDNSFQTHANRAQDSFKRAQSSVDHFNDAEIKINSKYEKSFSPDGNPQSIGKNLVPKPDLIDKVSGGLDKVKNNVLALTGLTVGTFGLLAVMPVLTDFIGKSIEANRNLSNLKTAMEFASGSSRQAASDLGFVGKTVDDLKIPLAASRQGFKKLAASTKGTALEGEGTRSIFTGMAQASTVLGLSTEEQDRTMTAFAQMASKGVVSMEELRGQMDALPGSFNIAARAMGMTTQELDKLVSSGNVTSVDLLPKIGRQLQAEFGGSAKDASQNAQSAQFNAGNEGLKLQEKVGAAIEPAVMAFYNGLAGILATINTAFEEMGTLIAATGLTAIGVAIAGLASHSMVFSAVLANIGPMIASAFAAMGPMLLSAVASFAAMLPMILLVNAAMQVLKGAFETFMPSDLEKKFDSFTTAAVDGLGKIEAAADKADGKIKGIGEGKPTELKSQGIDLNAMTLGVYGKMSEVLSEKDGPNPFLSAVERLPGVGGPVASLMKMAGSQLPSGANINTTDDIIKKMRSAPVLGGLFSGMSTQAERSFDDQKIKAGDMATAAQNVAGKVFDNNASGRIKKVSAIDDEIKAVDLEKQRLSLEGGKPDKLAMESLDKRKQKLTQERDAQSSPIIEQSAQVDAQIKNIKKAMEEIDAQGFPADKAKELKAQLEPTLAILEKAQKQQEQFNRKLSAAAILASQFGDNWQKALDKKVDAEKAIDMSATGQKAAVTNQLVSVQMTQGYGAIKSGDKAKAGEVTTGSVAFTGQAIDNATINSKLLNVLTTLTRQQELMKSIGAKDTLKAAGLEGMGVTELTSKEKAATDPRVKQAIKAQIDSLGMEDQKKQLEGQLADSSAAMGSQMREASKAAADFYRNIARGHEDLLSTLKGMRLDTALSDTKNKIKGALTGFHDTFIGDFANKIIEMLELTTQMAKNDIEAQNQILNKMRSIEDAKRQGAELLQSGPSIVNGSIGGGTGSTAGFVPGQYQTIATGTLAAQEYGAARGGGREHAGQDLDIGDSDSFQSYIGGQVTQMGDDPGGYFKWIDIYNDRLKRVERIAELDNLNVKVGDVVKPGQVVGSGTEATGVVHYEIRSDFDGQGKAGFGKQGTEDPVAYLQNLGLVRREGQALIPTGKVNQTAKIAEDDDHGTPPAKPTQKAATQSQPQQAASGGVASFLGIRNDADLYRLATTAITEGLSGNVQSQVDTAVAMGNRVQTGKWGNTASDVVSAEGQFEAWTRFGLQGVNDRGSAVAALNKNGYNGEEVLNQFMAGLSNPQTLQAAVQHVRGATDYRGPAPNTRKEAGDYQRDNSDNFYLPGGTSDASISVSEQQALLAKGQAALGGGGGIALPTTGVSQGTLQQQAALQAQAARNNGVISAGTELASKNFEDFKKETIAKVASENKGLGQQIEQLGVKAAGGLKRDVQDQTRAGVMDKRANEDREFTIGTMTPQRQKQKDLLTVNRQQEDLEFNATRDVEKAQATYDQAVKFRADFADLVKANPENKALRKALEALDSQIPQIKANLDTVKKQTAESLKTFAAQRKDIEDKFAIAEETTRLEADRRIGGVDNDLRGVQSTKMMRQGDFFGSQELTRQSQTQDINLGLRGQLLETQTLAREGKITADEADRLNKTYQAIAGIKLGNLTAELRKQRDELRFSSGQQLLGSRQNLAKANIQSMRDGGDEQGAREQEYQSAIASNRMDLTSQIKQIDNAVKSGQLLAETAIEMKNNLHEVSKVNLKNLETQYSPEKIMNKQAIKTMRDGVQGALQDVFSGKGFDFQSFIQKISDAGANMLSNYITDKLFNFGQGDKKTVKSADELMNGVDELTRGEDHISEAGINFKGLVVEAGEAFKAAVTGQTPGEAGVASAVASSDAVPVAGIRKGASVDRILEAPLKGVAPASIDAVMKSKLAIGKTIIPETKMDGSINPLVDLMLGTGKNAPKVGTTATTGITAAKPGSLLDSMVGTPIGAAKQIRPDALTPLQLPEKTTKLSSSLTSLTPNKPLPNLDGYSDSMGVAPIEAAKPTTAKSAIVEPVTAKYLTPEMSPNLPDGKGSPNVIPSTVKPATVTATQLSPALASLTPAATSKAIPKYLTPEMSPPLDKPMVSKSSGLVESMIATPKDAAKYLQPDALTPLEMPAKPLNFSSAVSSLGEMPDGPHLMDSASSLATAANSSKGLIGDMIATPKNAAKYLQPDALTPLEMPTKPINLSSAASSLMPSKPMPSFTGRTDTIKKDGPQFPIPQGISNNLTTLNTATKNAANQFPDSLENLSIATSETAAKLPESLAVQPQNTIVPFTPSDPNGVAQSIPLDGLRTEPLAKIGGYDPNFTGLTKVNNYTEANQQGMFPATIGGELPGYVSPASAATQGIQPSDPGQTAINQTAPEIIKPEAITQFNDSIVNAANQFAEVIAKCECPCEGKGDTGMGKALGKTQAESYSMGTGKIGESTTLSKYADYKMPEGPIGIGQNTTLDKMLATPIKPIESAFERALRPEMSPNLANGKGLANVAPAVTTGLNQVSKAVAPVGTLPKSLAPLTPIGTALTKQVNPPIVKQTAAPVVATQPVELPKAITEPTAIKPEKIELTAPQMSIASDAPTIAGTSSFSSNSALNGIMDQIKPMALESSPVLSQLPQAPNLSGVGTGMASIGGALASGASEASGILTQGIGSASQMLGASGGKASEGLLGSLSKGLPGIMGVLEGGGQAGVSPMGAIGSLLGGEKQDNSSALTSIASALQGGGKSESGGMLGTLTSAIGGVSGQQQQGGGGVLGQVLGAAGGLFGGGGSPGAGQGGGIFNSVIGALGGGGTGGMSLGVTQPTAGLSGAMGLGGAGGGGGFLSGLGGFGGIFGMLLPLLGPLLGGLFGGAAEYKPKEKKVDRIGRSVYGYTKSGDKYYQDKLLTPDFNAINAGYRAEKLPNFADGNMADLATTVPNFAIGNMDKIPSTVKGVPSSQEIKKALAKEGAGGVVAVLKPGELILTEKQTQKFMSSGMDKTLAVSNYANGNMKETAKNNIVPNYADGNLKSLSGGVNRGYMKGVPHPLAIEEALKREGSGGVVSVLHPNELILSKKQTKKFFAMGMDKNLSVPNYALGNMGGFNTDSIGYSTNTRVPNFAAGGLVSNNQSVEVNSPITVQTGGENDGGGKPDVQGFRNILDSRIKQLIRDETRPGGTLHNRR